MKHAEHLTPEELALVEKSLRQIATFENLIARHRGIIRRLSERARNRARKQAKGE